MSKFNKPGGLKSIISESLTFNQPTKPTTGQLLERYKWGQINKMLRLEAI